MSRAVAYINKNNFFSNLKTLKDLSGDNKIVLMCKANAYGHGLYEIMKLALEQNVYALGVACVSEALFLRKEGYEGPIYLFSGGSWLPSAEQIVENAITPMVCSKEEIICLNDYLKQNHKETITIHLNIDTGLMRDGFLYDELKDLVDVLKESGKIDIEGIFTHFSSADNFSCTFTDTQIERFTQALIYFKENNFLPKYAHMASSAATLSNKIKIENFPTTFLSRIGLDAYGLSPNNSCKDLFKPVLEIKGKIVAIKKLSKGQGVGYSHTYVAQKEGYVALISIGYGDGIRRMLSNKGSVIIKGVRVPIVGNISMDFLTADVSSIFEQGLHESLVNEYATILGQDGDQAITAYELADMLQTIPYEITTSISERVKRIIA